MKLILSYSNWLITALAHIVQDQTERDSFGEGYVDVDLDKNPVVVLNKYLNL